MLWLCRQHAGCLFLYRVEFNLEGGKRFEKAPVISVVDGYGRVDGHSMLRDLGSTFSRSGALSASGSRQRYTR